MCVCVYRKLKRHSGQKSRLAVVSNDNGMGCSFALAVLRNSWFSALLLRAVSTVSLYIAHSIIWV